MKYPEAFKVVNPLPSHLIIDGFVTNNEVLQVLSTRNVTQPEHTMELIFEFHYMSYDQIIFFVGMWLCKGTLSTVHHFQCSMSISRISPFMFRSRHTWRILQSNLATILKYFRS